MKNFFKYHKSIILINILIILALIIYFAFANNYNFIINFLIISSILIACVEGLSQKADKIKLNLGTTRHNLYKNHLKKLIKIIIFSFIYLLIIYLFIFIKSDFKDILYKDFILKYLFLLLNIVISSNIFLILNKDIKNIILICVYLIIICLNLVLFFLNYIFISLIIGFIFMIISILLNYYIFMHEKI